MKKSRLQSDDDQQKYSLAGGLSCAGSKDMTRQEQRPDSDIETMMKRFGLGTAPVPERTPRYGTWDESIDLQSAYTALDNVRRGYKKLPAEVKREFPTPLIFVNAIASGELAHYLAKEKTAAEAAAPAGAAPAPAPPKGQVQDGPGANKGVTG